MNRGLKRLVIGIALLILGVGTFVTTFLSLNRGASLDDQMKAPGTLHVQAQDAGRYYLWDNHKTIFEGERIKYKADCPADASVVVHDSTGTELQFVRDSSQGWSIGNHGKKTIGYVDLQAATELQIQAERLGRERILSFSNATIGEELWRRLGGFGIGAIIALFGLPIAVWGLIARSRRSDSSIQPTTEAVG